MKMKKITTLLFTVKLFASFASGDTEPPDEIHAVLSTVVPAFAITNTTLQAAISKLTADLQQLEPPMRLPVVLSNHPAWMGNPPITFSATQLRVSEILGIISVLSGAELDIMHGAVVLRKIRHEDWLTYQHKIGDRALRALGLTSNSTDEEVKKSLQNYGIHFDVGCYVQIIFRFTAPEQLHILLTLTTDESFKSRVVLRRLEDGLKIEQREPQQAPSEAIQ